MFVGVTVHMHMHKHVTLENRKLGGMKITLKGRAKISQSCNYSYILL